MESGGRRRRAFSSLAGNTALLRVLAAYLLFILTEYAVWIAMLVFAYNRGGTAVAGLVAVAQLAPAAVVAPVAASLADRRSPVVMLAGGYLAQVAGMAGTAAAIGAGAPLAAYAAAVVASTAVTATRPAQSALIPSLAATPDQLTAANVVAGWLEAAGAAAAGLLVGVLISLAGVGSVFAVCAGLGLAAALLVAGLRARRWRRSRSGRRTPARYGRGRRRPAAGGPAAAAAAHAGPADRRCGRGGRAGPAGGDPGPDRARPPAELGRLPGVRLRRGGGAGRHGERAPGRTAPGRADPGRRAGLQRGAGRGRVRPGAGRDRDLAGGGRGGPLACWKWPPAPCCSARSRRG